MPIKTNKDYCDCLRMGAMGEIFGNWNFFRSTQSASVIHAVFYTNLGLLQGVKLSEREPDCHPVPKSRMCGIICPL